MIKIKTKGDNSGRKERRQNKNKQKDIRKYSVGRNKNNSKLQERNKRTVENE